MSVVRRLLQHRTTLTIFPLIPMRVIIAQMVSNGGRAYMKTRYSIRVALFAIVMTLSNSVAYDIPMKRFFCCGYVSNYMKMVAHRLCVMVIK